MKIAVIGATGRVGPEIVKEALSRGHEVTAIARDPSKLPARPHLRQVKADIMDPADAARALRGHDAVISAFNPGWTNPNIRQDITRGFAGMIAGLKQAGVKRVVFIGGAGSLVEGGERLVDKPDFHPDWKPGALGAADALDMVRKENDLDWTFVSPAVMLNDGERTAKYRHGKEAPVRNDKGESHITVPDLAHAILDEIEKPKHIRQRLTVGY
jgi:putative NADH-flavin reductase